MGVLEGLAYLFGNVQPDILFTSYLSDVAPGDECRGHNYRTAMLRIRRLATSLVPDGITAAYTLGKITHYAADIFTYPHNPDIFHDTLLCHMKYERVLDEQLEAALDGKLADSFEFIGNAEEFLESLHSRYILEEHSVSNDISYIIPAALALRKAYSFEPGRIRALSGNLR